jgi:predicted ATPase
MLTKIKISKFKSIFSQTVQLSPFNVVFGPNAVGKSNLLDAIQVLSRLATERTVRDALQEPIRGNPIEAFQFPAGGLRALIAKPLSDFELDAEFDAGAQKFKYKVKIQINPKSGALTVADEYLARVSKKGDELGRAAIEASENFVHVRPTSQVRIGRREEKNQNHTKLSDARLSGPEYSAIDRCRKELAGWRVYYLDPRSAMRASVPPAEVDDIGIHGECISQFLYRLKKQQSDRYQLVVKTLKTLIPSITNVSVALDENRGVLELSITQYGVMYSARIVSEGTLRILALCAIAHNPWAGSLIGIEEPENGVQPQRIELIAKVLCSLSSDARQVIVTSHSPLFCSSALAEARSMEKPVSLLAVSNDRRRTKIRSFDANGPLFDDSEIRTALTASDEQDTFRRLMLQGFLNG